MRCMSIEQIAYDKMVDYLILLEHCDYPAYLDPAEQDAARQIYEDTIREYYDNKALDEHDVDYWIKDLDILD